LDVGEQCDSGISIKTNHTSKTILEFVCLNWNSCWLICCIDCDWLKFSLCDCLKMKDLVVIMWHADVWLVSFDWFKLWDLFVS
jgi:hypothetical protein